MSLRPVDLLALLALLPAACGDAPSSGPVWMPTVGGDGTDDGVDGDDDDADDDDDDDNGDDDDDDDSRPDDDDDDDDHTGDDDDDDDGTVPELGSTFTVIGTSADGLDIVRDLEFNPADPTELWTANRGFHGSVIFFDPGTEIQGSEVRVDIYAQHFMSQVSSMAMGDGQRWACCNESRNEWNGGPQAPDDFMGPTLWSSDLSVYAFINQGNGGGEGSHMDMLHQSPLCMGIAHDTGNRYWVFDGLNGHVVYYDFAADHGPGGSDHSDGTIRRYTDATLTRVADVPGHMEVDHGTGLLYVADTGAGRIMVLDTGGGAYSGSLPGNWDGLDEYSAWNGASWSVFASGLSQPSGLALHDGRVFVSDHATNEIVAFDLSGAELGRTQTEASGIMGITVGPQGQLWYADGARDEVVRVDP